MAVLDDEVTQKRGVVVVSYSPNGPPPKKNPRLIWRIYKVLGSVPAHFRGFHVATSSKLLAFFFSKMRNFLDKRTRTRSRIHLGEFFVPIQQKVYNIILVYLSQPDLLLS
jgi:hypothetical protein